jgi:hypothetical protein
LRRIAFDLKLSGKTVRVCFKSEITCIKTHSYV